MNVDRKMTVRLTESCYDRLEEYSQGQGLKVGFIVRRLVEQYLSHLDAAINPDNPIRE